MIHILQIHSGSSELVGESCFDVYCDCREEIVSDLFRKELDSICSNDETLEAQVVVCVFCEL